MQITKVADKNLEAKNRNLLLFCDGGSRGNPGLAACGFVVAYGQVKVEGHKIVQSDFEQILTKQGIFLGTNLTNNQAEWLSLIHGLDWLINQGLSTCNLAVIMDSNLVINQIQSNWKINKPHLKEYFVKAKEQLSTFNSVRFCQVLRQYNSEADQQVNLALDRYLSDLSKNN